MSRGHAAPSVELSAVVQYIATWSDGGTDVQQTSKGPPKDIFPSGPPTDGNFGGDGVSCASGYESDGQGGCIPFGKGDYGFEDVGPPSEEQSPPSEETFNEPPPEPEPIPESAPEPLPTTGAVIKDNF